MPNLIYVPFRGDTLHCVRDNDGEPYLVIRPACEVLNLDYSAQLKRLRGSCWATVAMIATVGNDGRTREMACLNLRAVAMWLATIDIRRIRNLHLRERFRLYQMEAADTLDDHLGTGRRQVSAVSGTSRADLEAALTASLAPHHRHLEALTANLATLTANLATLSSTLSGHGARPEASEATTSPWPEASEAPSPGLDKERRKGLRSLIRRIAKTTGTSFETVRVRFFGHFAVSDYGQIKIREFGEAQQFLSDLLTRARQSRQMVPPSTQEPSATETPPPPEPVAEPSSKAHQEPQAGYPLPNQTLWDVATYQANGGVAYDFQQTCRILREHFPGQSGFDTKWLRQLCQDKKVRIAYQQKNPRVKDSEGTPYLRSSDIPWIVQYLRDFPSALLKPNVGQAPEAN